MFSALGRLGRRAVSAGTRSWSSNGYLGNVVVIPCRNKTGTGELVVLGSVMITCWLAVPTWVLLHVRDYNGQRAAEGN